MGQKLKRGAAIQWMEVPGTNIDTIRASHPEWSEDECRAEQKRAAFEAFGLTDAGRAAGE